MTLKFTKVQLNFKYSILAKVYSINDSICTKMDKQPFFAV